MKTIGVEAFRECKGLTSLTLNNGLERIWDYAFQYTSIKSLVIPESILELGESVFYNCGELKSLKLPKTLKVIPNYIFSNCGKLKTVEIPSGVEEIGLSAFAMCTDIISITIPASVKKMEGCFAGCFGLEEVRFEGDFPAPMNQSFMMCTLTVYYPLDNATWTDEVRDSGYGGKVKWQGYCSSHKAASAVKENVKEATALKAGSYDSVVYCSKCKAEISRKTVTVKKLTPTIKLSATKKTLKKGKTYTLKVTGLAKGDAVKSFKTSKKAVATVTSKGKIKAKKKGKAVITVTLKSGKTAKCTITVK